MGLHRHLISMDDLSRTEIEALIAAGEEMKRDPDSYLLAIRGKQVALMFEKPSTRTRVSFEAAITSMGGHAIVLRPDEMQLGNGETIEDTGRVLSSFVDAIVSRTSGQERLERLAESATVPVVNGLSDREHPCQALADLMTIRERVGGLEGVKVAYIGDGNNVAHSLMIGCSLVGASISVATPAGFEPFPSVIARCRELTKSSGAVLGLTNDPAAVVVDADIIYTDVWTSMGNEAQAEDRREHFLPFRLDDNLLGAAPAGAFVMHCLPAHRGEEITSAVLDGPRSIAWDQAANRLHSEKALLAWLLGDG